MKNINFNVDYYKILGINKYTTQEDVKASYKKLALKYHPDKTGGNKKAEGKFKEISEANEVLKNPKTRQEYDMNSPFGQYSQGNRIRDYQNSIMTEIFRNIQEHNPHRKKSKPEKTSKKEQKTNRPKTDLEKIAKDFFKI